MKILFLTQVLPFPLDAGPKVRAYHVIRHLAAIGHEITLLSFVRGTDRVEHIAHLEQYCSEVHAVPIDRSSLRDGLSLLRSLAVRKPFLIVRDWMPRMVREIMRICGRFDAIHSDQLWMAPYALLARDRVPSGARPLLVLDQHNAVFNIPKRLAESEKNPLKRKLLELEARTLAEYEKSTCRQFDQVVWVTEEDRCALDAAPGLVIPIAVDACSGAHVAGGASRRRVTFMGGLHWPPNSQGVLWFYREIWPRIRRAVPDAVLTIIGRDAPAEFAEARDSSIEVTGYVKDPAAYLAETAVFVVPLLAGGGMRVKILDAWARGLPIVSTTIGAEGIRARHGHNMLVADLPEAFGQAVVDLMSDASLSSTLLRGGRASLENFYDCRKVYRAWESIYPAVSVQAASA